MKPLALNHTHKDDVEDKLVVQNVLLEHVVVYLVGVEPHQTIVLLESVKVNVFFHPHHHIQKDDAENKLLLKDHVLLDSVAV